MKSVGKVGDGDIPLAVSVRVLTAKAGMTHDRDFGAVRGVKMTRLNANSRAEGHRKQNRAIVAGERKSIGEINRKDLKLGGVGV